MSEKIPSMEICPICQQPMNAHAEDCSYEAVKKEHQEWENKAEEMTPEFRKEFSTGKRTAESQMADIEKEIEEMENLGSGGVDGNKLNDAEKNGMRAGQRIIREVKDFKAVFGNVSEAGDLKSLQKKMENSLDRCQGYLQECLRLATNSQQIAEEKKIIQQKYSDFHRRFSEINRKYNSEGGRKNKADCVVWLSELNKLSGEIESFYQDKINGK